jgi:hypothetical protein
MSTIWRVVAADGATAAVVNLAAARIRRKKILNGLVNEYSAGSVTDPHFRTAQGTRRVPRHRAPNLSGKTICATASKIGSKNRSINADNEARRSRNGRILA